jgi:hypothetical protein
MDVLAFNTSAQAVMPVLSLSPNILLLEASKIDNALLSEGVSGRDIRRHQ